MNATQAPHTAADTPAGSANGEDRATTDARDTAARPSALGMDPDQITLTEAVDLLGQVNDAASQVHAQMVRLVEVVDVLARSGRVEEIEGLPLDLFLCLEHKMTHRDVWALLETARVLGHLPATRMLFRHGRLSWSPSTSRTCSPSPLAKPSERASPTLT
jgi:hypothetical protein